MILQLHLLELKSALCELIMRAITPSIAPTGIEMRDTIMLSEELANLQLHLLELKCTVISYYDGTQGCLQLHLLELKSHTGRRSMVCNLYLQLHLLELK